MQRELITSPIFDSIGYDPASQTLEILFNDGEMVHFKNVPPEVNETLMMKTVGAYEHYYDLYIDNGTYEKVVIEDD